jgi:hypothetical protein
VWSSVANVLVGIVTAVNWLRTSTDTNAGVVLHLGRIVQER